MTVQFELFPSRTLLLCLVEGVTNAAELRQEVLKQKFEASFIDAAMVPAPPCRAAPAPFPSTTFHGAPKRGHRLSLHPDVRTHADVPHHAPTHPTRPPTHPHPRNNKQVADLFHLQAAANKALYASSKDALTTHGTMRKACQPHFAAPAAPRHQQHTYLQPNAPTNTGIHTELIFCLLGGRSISNALRYENIC